MKRKIFSILILCSTLTGLNAQDDELASEIGWLSFGLGTSVSSKFEGTELNAIETGKFVGNLGWAQTVIDPIPLYIGWEFNVAFAMIGEESTTATVYTEYLGYYGTFGESSYTAKYWDLDISPRIVALLKLGTLSASAYAGINANYLIMDWQYTDSLNPVNNDADTEIVNGPVWQAVAGFRATFHILYADYTRYFNINNGKIDRTNVAGNRLGLGIIFLFD